MASGYYLISKIKNLPYNKYTSGALRITEQKAAVVDEIVAGKKNNPNLIRSITTFKDSNGDIIERVINFPHKPYRNRIYKKCDHVIGNDEFVTSTNVKEYTLQRMLKKTYQQAVQAGLNRTLFWNPVKFFTNHMSENIDTGEKILTQVSQTNLLKPQKEVHTFTEFPHIINRKVSDTTKKILQFEVNRLYNYRIDTKKILEQDAKLPQNDSFLGIRALGINDSKNALAQKFLSERDLANKRIKINSEYVPECKDEELTKALFDPNEGLICFVKNQEYKSKSEVAKIARHEVEHGWQFYLHARNTQGGETPWEELIYNLYRDLPRKLKKEAQEYTESIQNYVTIAENREKYRKNFIEIRAREEGSKAQELYDNERAEIQKEFPHIPQELL